MECNEEYSLFRVLLHQRLGPGAIVDNLADLGTEDMLSYDPFEYESQNIETSLFSMKNQR